MDFPGLKKRVCFNNDLSMKTKYVLEIEKYFLTILHDGKTWMVYKADA